jgi:hypothetical protein
MVKKSITIPENIYEEVKEEENFSSLVALLLSEHISRAKSSFGSWDDDMCGVDYVNSMRAEGSRKLPEMD